MKTLIKIPLILFVIFLLSFGFSYLHYIDNVPLTYKLQVLQTNHMLFMKYNLTINLVEINYDECKYHNTQSKCDYY